MKQKFVENLLPKASAERTGLTRLATLEEIQSRLTDMTKGVACITPEHVGEILNAFDIGSANYRLLVSNAYVDEANPAYLTRDLNMPTNITLNSIYKLTNPFGNNTPVICIAEIFANNNWGTTGWTFYQTAQGYGVGAGFKLGSGISLYTGSGSLHIAPIKSNAGGTLDAPTNTSAAPCRVHVFKVGNEAGGGLIEIPIATTVLKGIGRIATPLEVLNKQSVANSEQPAFVAVDDLKVLFGADFDTAGYKCIVSSDSTEIGEYIVKDPNLPVNISDNVRYVLQNPFGNNTPVQVKAEVYANGKWGETGYYIYSGLLIGAIANFFEGVGIVIQTGSYTANQLLANSASSGNPFGIATGVIGKLPCRVHVYKNGTKNTAQEYADYKVIYSAADLTDRGPESVKDNALPANITLNSKYILSNPFGVDEHCECVAEIFADNEWSTSGTNTYYASFHSAYFTTASCKQGIGIVIQTGLSGLLTVPKYSGSNTSNAGLTVTTPVPVRVKCYKTGYNGNLATQSKPGIVRMATPEELKNKKSVDPNIGCVISPESLAQITTIGNQGSSGYKCIYSKDFVGELGTNGIKDDSLPLNITVNSRYVLANPFGVNTPIECTINLFINDEWHVVGSAAFDGNGSSYIGNGLDVNYLENKGIIVQTYSGGLWTSSNLGGGTMNITTGDSVKTFPCRIHVWKVGESDIPVFSGPLPETHIFDYLYSTEYESIMKWDVTLKLYRSIRPIDIGYSLYTSDKLSKGQYSLDGSGFELTSKQGKVLNSIDTDIKTRWKITTVENMIYLPNMAHTDGRTFYLRHGLDVGSIMEDGIRNLTGGLNTNTNGNAQMVYMNSSNAVPANTKQGTLRYKVDKPNIGLNSSGSLFSWGCYYMDASEEVPTANENLPLTRIVTNYIDLGI